jgi:DNA-binding transcriptional LysR family regulator
VDADLRLLRYFVVVAEELNFTRAAQRLHMTQQPLSAAIRRLEADLGVELFTRTTRHVALTPAGNAMLEPARAALTAGAHALATARATRGQLTGELQLGLSTGARYGFEPLFAALADRHPDLHLRVHQDSARPLITMLQDGRLDLAITFATRIPDSLHSERLKNEPAVLALPIDHPLADRDTLTLAELSDQTLALDVPGDNPDYDQAVIDACRRAGFEPRTRASPAFHDAWEGAMHEGCVGLTVRTALHAAHRDLKLIPLHHPPMLPLDLAWSARPTASLALIEAVLESAREIRDHHHWLTTTAAPDTE